MINKLHVLLTKYSFKNLLATTYVIGISLLIAIATLVTSNLSTRSVHESLNKTGAQLIESFSDNSRIALLYQSRDEAKLVTESILSFPDVTAAGIYNPQMQPIYQTTDQLGKNTTNLPENTTVLDYENELEWSYTAPVFSTQDDEAFLYSVEEFKPELLGYVRLTVSKGVLSTLERNFYKYNLIVIGILALLLLWALLIVTKRITKPIDNLAEHMLEATKGKLTKTKSIGTTRDIIKMEHAFSDMMQILDNREKELITTRDLAVEAAKVKSEFAANVSHELRTPLNGISGMLELLSEMDLNAQQQEYLRVASTSAASLLELIDDVLDFSKYDINDVSLHHESFNLRNTLENTITLLSTQAHKKNLSIAYFLDQDTPCQLIADELRLQQILQNLLGNALKFTRDGEVTINTSIVKPGEKTVTLLFEIKDTGVGIPEEAQSKIFNAFSQADNSTTREFGGTGLGLAIAQQLVTMFNGEIGVKSKVGEGSTFWFTGNFTIDNQSEHPQLSTNSKNLNILYVGDDHLSTRFIKQQLQALSYFADYVTDAPSTIRKLRNHKTLNRPYDFILVDTLQSMIDQRNLIRMVNTDETINKTKVIALVDNGPNNLNLKSEGLNIFQYMNKPVMLNDLALKLNLPSDTAIQQSTEQDEQLPHYEGKNILVVEDNKANQIVAEGMLEKFKCAITIANNGLEALQIFSSQSFDLIFMDCQMPEMDGYEATFQIRELENKAVHTPIIALTANKQLSDREQCIAAGMDDFMSKPLTLNALKKALKKWLSLTPKSNQAQDLITTVLDEVSYAQLKENLGSRFNDVLDAFVQQMPDHLSQLASEVAQANLVSINKTLHTIRSSATNVGALRLYQACETMEKTCENNESNTLSLQLKIILFEAELAIKEVSSRKNQPLSTLPEAIQTEYQSKILLINSSKTIRLDMKSTLESAGHYVDEVINSHQGMMYCERNKPDVVILEQTLSGDNEKFEDACLTLKKHDIPFIVTSSTDSETSINNAFTSGAVDYFSAPINFALFTQRINKLITAKLAENKIFDLAHKDHLTGLMNRSLFTKKVSDYLTQHERDGKLFALIFLDLDRFKLVNDSYGHEAGDLLLKIVAERLSRSVREVDIISRFGGDEFVIGLSDIKSHKIIEKLAQKIQNNLSRPFVFLGKEMHVNASLGISVFPQSGTTVSDLVKNADIAMYLSKQSKTPYVFFDDSMAENINKRLTIENELRNVILRNELNVFYQPQFSLSTGKLIGMEALVRWQHPEKGLIPPNDFIGLAEETGQIHMIGEWVLQTACLTLKNWIERGASPIRVAVNLSNLQLEDEEIINKISATLNSTQLPHKLLELEITESAVMNNEQLVIDKLEVLKNLGIKLAIDDFGTGYSSLSYLKRLPINLLKIDRSFVNNSLSNKADEDIIKTIIVLAHSMGVEVIAEGVETREQSTLLEELHCDYVQGYYFGKPMPAEEFEKLLFPKANNNVYPISLLQ